MKGRENSTVKTDVAVIKNDLIWIKGKLSSIDKKFVGFQEYLMEIDNRVRGIEDWRQYKDQEFNKEIAKWGLIIAGLSVIISIIVSTAHL